MKKVIFLVSGIFQIGGIQKFNDCFLNALIDQFPDCQVTILSLNDSPRNLPPYPPNVHIHCFGDIPSTAYRKAIFGILFSQLCRQEIDLIICGHVHFSTLCLLMKAIFKKPFMVIAHGIDVWGLKRGLRYQCLKNADLIMTVSQYSRLRMFVNGIAPDKIKLLFNTVDTGFFFPKPFKQSLINDLGLKGKKVLLTVSRMDRAELYKGHTQVLKALRILNDDYVWIIAGSGNAEPLIKKRASQLGVTHKTRFVGSPDAAALVDLYNLCDVFVLPSKKEGFGIVFLEAMACGKPVIAGNRDGSRQALLNGELGFLVDADDPKEIAQAIEAAFDPSDKRTNASYLRSMVEKNFGLIPFRNRVKEILGQYLSESKQNDKDLMMKKIVLLSPEIIKFGGIQKFTSCLLAALANEFPGSRITVFSLNDSRVDGSKFPANVQIHCFRGSRFGLSAQLFHYLSQEKPDLVICGHVNFAELALYMRFIFKTPYAVVTYGKEVWDLQWGLKYQALKKADLITTLSRYTASGMISHGVPEKKIVILWCTVDTDFFIPKRRDPVLMAELGLEGKKIILTVSRLAISELRKGHAQVLKSLQMLNDDYVWIVAGSGDVVPLLKRQAQELGVTHKVRFVGAPDTSKLLDFYNLCDVFILASKKEGFGIVFIEAMACGKPVIAGNKDGSREPLLDGELGFLVDPDAPPSIARAIEASFGRSDKRTDPEYLRTRVKETFGLAAFRSRVKEIFSKF